LLNTNWKKNKDPLAKKEKAKRKLGNQGITDDVVFCMYTKSK